MAVTKVPNKYDQTLFKQKSPCKLNKRLGKKALGDVVSVVNPETVLAWHRKLIARKSDGSTSIQPSSNSSSNSLRRIAPGAMIALSVLKNVGYTVGERPNGPQHLKAASPPPSPRTKKGHDMARVYSLPLGPLGRHRFLDHGSLDEKWVGDLIHPVFYPGWKRKGAHCWTDTKSQWAMDDPHGAQCDYGGVGFPDPRSTSDPRPGYQVLLVLSGDPQGGRRHPHHPSST